MFKVWALRAAVAITVAGWVSTVRADPYDAPSDYYYRAAAVINAGSTVDAETLKTALRSTVSLQYGSTSTAIINPSYDQISTAILTLDQVSTDSTNKLLLIYTRNISTDTQPTGTNSATGWNREHIWLASQLRPTASNNIAITPYHDEFNLRPATPSVNSTRNNRNFGGTLDDAASNSSSGSDQYSPGAADRGDVARTLFYMATRYSEANNTTASQTNLRLVKTSVGTAASGMFTMGDLDAALHYHYQDLPDSFERRRNSLVFSGMTLSQGNRNPYIDHPEYVWAVFGGGANDSKISVATPAANGASSKSIAFTPVIVGGSVGTLTQSVAISKAGNDPTTYSVTAAGAATSSANGIYNAFNFDPAATSITVGLNANSSAAGRQSGTVTLDNTDLTTAGTGTGSADGNDTIDVSMNVLDHSNASFSNASDSNALSIDFDSVGQGTSASKSFNLYNLLATAGFTAGLDLDTIKASGDTDVFNTDLSMLLNLAGGDSMAYLATFAPRTSGVFSATYVLSVSDQNLVGATTGAPLTLTLNGIAVVPEPMGIAGLLVFGAMLRRRSR